MTKRRRANELIFGKRRGLKWPTPIVAVTSGTGTNTGANIITVVAASSAAATQAYINVSATTNVGTLIGTQ